MSASVNISANSRHYIAAASKLGESAMAGGELWFKPRSGHSATGNKED
jgi:hypothetical protein